jgi:hypothetical protein
VDLEPDRAIDIADTDGDDACQRSEDQSREEADEER